MNGFADGKNNISLNNTCVLIMQSISKGKYGTEETTESERETFCGVISISMSEFFTAGKDGIKPEICLAVRSEEYEGERKARFDNDEYDIYRIYGRTDGYTELYCKRRLRNGSN